MKIFNLTYNELIKQFKKPSIKIFFLIVIISAIAIPNIVNVINSNDEIEEIAISNSEYMLNSAEENLEYFSREETEIGKIQYKYAEIDKEIAELFIEHAIWYNDWEAEVTTYYEEARNNELAIEFVMDEYDRDLLMQSVRGINPAKIDEYFNDTEEELEEIKAFYEKEALRFKAIIENNDYNEFTKERLNKEKGSINTYTEYIEEYEKSKIDDLNEEEIAELNEGIARYENLILDAEERINIIEFRLDNDIDYQASNWKHNAIESIESMTSKLSENLMSEEDYINNEYAILSYNDYVKVFNTNNNERRTSLKELWYNLENDIATLEGELDARSSLNLTYEIYIMLAVFIVIIVSAGIVSSEFSKGTIRLLLIRPVSRWKILLSKFLAVLVFGAVTIILGIGILFAVSGLVFGFDGYSTAIIDTVNNTVVEVSFNSYILSKIALSCTGVIFIASLSFMISTISKNTAISVATSMLIYLGSALATTVVFAFLNKPEIMNTLVPYINSSYLRLMGNLETALMQTYGMKMQYELGGIQLIIVSMIMLVISFVYFIKRDVRN